jgi:hypothetical protein
MGAAGRLRLPEVSISDRTIVNIEDALTNVGDGSANVGRGLSMLTKSLSSLVSPS